MGISIYLEMNDTDNCYVTCHIGQAIVDGMISTAEFLQSGPVPQKIFEAVQTGVANFAPRAETLMKILGEVATIHPFISRTLLSIQ